jgi:superfamily I DNA and/or RNA helicase
MPQQIKFTIPLNPYTKKNGQQIVYAGKYPKIVQSKLYKAYEKDCGWYLNKIKPIPSGLINIEAHYYRKTLHKVDLSNLNAALHDILVYYNIIEDDHYEIVGGSDGSRVFIDKINPRTEVTITYMNENKE